MTKPQLSRRDVMKAGAGVVAGVAATWAGSGLTHLSAQGGAVVPTPPPATDPRFPMPPTWNRELRQLAPNVYAYTQGGGPNMSGPGVSNAGLIVGPDYLLAIDALQGPIPAKDFIMRARQAGGGKPIARLVSTHHHGDHVAGNQFFTGAEISSHPYCRNEVLKAVANTPKTWNATPNVAAGGEPRVLVPPTVTFMDDLTYFLGTTEVQFRFAGPAHTWGDLMAYLPQHKILFTGDVGFFWVAPYANNSFITKWIETCDKIAGWDVDVIVPGHGPIGGKNELAEMGEYFRVLMREAKKRFEAGMSPGQAAADIRLGKFDNWIGPEQIVMNVVRLYHHFNGTVMPEVDREGMLKATLEYNAIKSKGR